MKDKVRFNKAIKSLVSAFFDGTLAKGSCQACAVGNMVASSFGVKTNIYTSSPIKNNEGVEILRWSNLFLTTESGQHFRERFTLLGSMNTSKEDIEIALNLISKTGYSEQELAKVEYVFETNTKIMVTKYRNFSKDEIMQDQYNGLMAVVEVLCEIEGIENPSEYKEMFAFQKA